MKTSQFFKKTYRARILIESARFPPFGFAIAEISSNSKEVYRFYKKAYRARILIESARFPPFGFAIAEISSNSKEVYRFYKKAYRARILIESARFPPFGFHTTEISPEATKCLGGNREAKSILFTEMLISIEKQRKINSFCIFSLKSA